MFGIGSQELLIVFLVVLLLFGAERIPEVARSLGKSIRDFKKAAGEIEAEIQEAARQKDALLGKEAVAGRPGGRRPGREPRPQTGADDEGRGDVRDESEPPGRESEPPGRGSEPPGRESEPPGRESEPPGRESEPPGRGSEPPGRESEPPGT